MLKFRSCLESSVHCCLRLCVVDEQRVRKPTPTRLLAPRNLSASPQWYFWSSTSCRCRKWHSSTASSWRSTLPTSQSLSQCKWMPPSNTEDHMFCFFKVLVCLTRFRHLSRAWILKASESNTSTASETSSQIYSPLSAPAVGKMHLILQNTFSSSMVSPSFGRGKLGLFDCPCSCNDGLGETPIATHLPRAHLLFTGLTPNLNAKRALLLAWVKRHQACTRRSPQRAAPFRGRQSLPSSSLELVEGADHRQHRQQKHPSCWLCP